jgi:hypothetical protein
MPFSTGLLVLLYRLRYPNRYSDWVRLYGRGPAEGSLIFNWMLNFIYDKFGHLLQSLNLWWLDQNHLANYATAITNEGSPLPNCWGFLDGNIIRTILYILCSVKKQR